MDGTYQSPQIASPGVAAPAGTCYHFIGTDGRMYIVTPGSAIALPVGNELFVDIATQAVTGAIASQALFAATFFAQLFAKLTLAGGSGAYAVNLVLPVANLITPCTVEINLEFAASANPQVNIYDTSTGGTLLDGPIANPNPGVVSYYYGKFKFGRDGHWHLITNNWN